jgi:DNA-directed RNA polymerase subunit RPC12/RpoP
MLIGSDENKKAIATTHYKCPECSHDWHRREFVKLEVDPEYQKQMDKLKTELETYCPFCHGRLDNGQELWGKSCHKSCRDQKRRMMGIA